MVVGTFHCSFIRLCSVHIYVARDLNVSAVEIAKANASFLLLLFTRVCSGQLYCKYAFKLGETGLVPHVTRGPRSSMANKYYLILAISISAHRYRFQYRIF
jgi:hypothetical protein